MLFQCLNFKNCFIKAQFEYRTIPFIRIREAAEPWRTARKNEELGKLITEIVSVCRKYIS